MDLWIRGQNRYVFLKVYDLQLDRFNATKDSIMIVERINSEECIILGEYKSQKRALEVLDEIAGGKDLKATKIGYVYEMPKE